uniref:Protein phosphatase 1 regulatory subunit 14 n=1 Tax=Equus asinus TaxID=9793 RepID=A0A8C4MV38_EQUAS
MLQLPPGAPAAALRRGAARTRAHELTRASGPEPAGGRPGGGGAGRGPTRARGPGGRHGGQRPRGGRGVGGPGPPAGRWRPRAPRLLSEPPWGCRRGPGRRGRRGPSEAPREGHGQVRPQGATEAPQPGGVDPGAAHSPLRLPEEIPELEIDVDELLDMESDDTRAARVKELLVDCYKPTEAFISGLLDKIRGMQKLSTPQKK